MHGPGPVVLRHGGVRRSGVLQALKDVLDELFLAARGQLLVLTFEFAASGTFLTICEGLLLHNGNGSTNIK